MGDSEAKHHVKYYILTLELNTSTSINKCTAERFKIQEEG